jgi:hypothetical protein
MNKLCSASNFAIYLWQSLLFLEEKQEERHHISFFAPLFYTATEDNRRSAQSQAQSSSIRFFKT